MFRTIVWFIYFGVSLILLIPSFFKAKRYDKENKIEIRDKFVHKHVRKWARSVFKLSGSSIKVVGEENIPKSDAVLFVGNHQGNFDIPALLGFVDKPKAFVAKTETKKIPFVSSWMELMQCVFMDRTNPRQSIKAIKAGIKKLKDGYSIVIFPEGTRSKDGTLGEFKSGSLRLATKAKVPIVPVTINGTKDIMIKGSLKIRPADVEIIISPPINPEEYAEKDTKEITEEVKGIIEKNLKG